MPTSQKLSLFLCTCLLSLASISNADSSATDVKRLSQPVVTDEVSETFGEPLNKNLPKVTLATATSDANYLGKEILIESRVGQVCQKKGCFFVAMEGDLAVRVSFKDYSFFIPTDSGNKTVTLAGQVVEVELSEDQLAHFNQDAGNKKLPIHAGKMYEIIASGVRIPI